MDFFFVFGFMCSLIPPLVFFLQTTSGETYEGVFSSIDDKQLTIRVCKLVGNAKGDKVRTARPIEVKHFPAADWVRIDSVDVRMTAADVGTMNPNDDVGGFGTDAAISRGRGGAQGRELQRWTPDVTDEDHLMHLEDSVQTTKRGWDQFALNEAKFGVKTDYKEELYTTVLDPSSSKISMAEAERIAAEIERGTKVDTTNIHLLEERGVELDYGDMDEEDRYGAVIREKQGDALEEASTASSSSRVNAWLRDSHNASAPIEIQNTRREANKVVSHLTGSVGKGTSPYGTPKSKAALTSPLVGDVQKLEALNLNPASARFDDETMRQFQEFKAKQGRGVGPNGPTLTEMKQFSELLQNKLQRKSSSSSVKVQTQVEEPTIVGTNASTTDKVTPSSSISGDPKKSTLNPNAKSFSFNVSAKEFTPSFGTGPASSKAARSGAQDYSNRDGRASDTNDEPSSSGSNYRGSYHSSRRFENDRNHDRKRDDTRYFDRKGGMNGHPGPGSHGRSPPNVVSNRMTSHMHHARGMMGAPITGVMPMPGGPAAVTMMIPGPRPTYGVVPTYPMGGMPGAPMPGRMAMASYAMAPSGIPVTMPQFTGRMSGPGFSSHSDTSPGSSAP